MDKIFKCILYQSFAGGITIIALLLLKPLAAKKFSAKWQYFAWLFAALFMLFPFCGLASFTADMPVKNLQIAENHNNTTAEEHTDLESKISEGGDVQNEQRKISNSVPFEYKTLRVSGGYIRIFEILGAIWFLGAVIFLSSALISRLKFGKSQRKARVFITKSNELEELKKLLGIKRKIRLCISKNLKSPLLAGIIFPTIYLLTQPLEEKSERLVIMHELVHFKHRDLVFKFIGLLACAVHWFNPFAYILADEISKVCEMYCDETVIKNLDENETNLYMKTILDLAEKNSN